MTEISDRELDALIRRAIEHERDKAPAPREWLSIRDRPRLHRRRSWMVLASAAMIMAGVVALTMVTRPSSPTTDTPAPAPGVPTSTAAQPTASNPVSTTATPATTPAPPISAIAPSTPLGFTPLLLDPVPEGFRLVWSRFDAQGDDVYGMARYAGPDASPDIVLITRNTPGFFDEAVAQGRTTWDVGGRTVVRDGEGSGACLPDTCSVGTQWDERTAISVTWDGRTVPLTDANTAESLLELIPTLVEAEGRYEPGMPDPASYGWYYPLEATDLVVAGSQAGNPALVLDNGHSWAQRADMIARAGFSVGDGRIVVDTVDGPRVLDPNGVREPWANVNWTAPVRIHDVANVDGTPTALISQPDDPACLDGVACPVTLRLSPLDRYEPVTLTSGVAGVDSSTRLSLTNDGTVAGFVLVDGKARALTLSASGANLASTADESARSLAVDQTGLRAVWTERDQLVTEEITSEQVTRAPLPAGLRSSDILGIDLAVEPNGNALVVLSVIGGDVVLLGPNNEAHRTSQDLKGIATLSTRTTDTTP